MKIIFQVLHSVVLADESSKKICQGLTFQSLAVWMHYEINEDEEVEFQF